MYEYTNVYSNNGLTFSEYLRKVFLTVSAGLGITAVISFVISEFFMEALLTRYGAAFATVSLMAMIGEFVIAIVFAARLTKMSKSSAWTCYILYSVLTGISLSMVLYAYTETSVWVTFLVTCGMFVVLSLIGNNTNVDLSKFSGIIVPGLLAIIIVSIVNVIFFRSQMVQWVVNYLGIILFLFLIAYDMQKLRNLYNVGLQDASINDALMIYGAFQLYLDFINLFLRLLQIFGKMRNSDD